MAFDRASHGWKKVPDLREECKYRGLDHKGSKYDLISRLSQADEDAETPDGKKLDYERRLKVQQKKRLASIKPFRQFKKIAGRDQE